MSVAPVSSFQPTGLLSDKSKQRLRIDVDFGTGNSCAAFVVVDRPDAAIGQWFGNVQPLHAQKNLVRFPTLVAIRPSRRTPDQGELISASDVLESLKHNLLRQNILCTIQNWGWSIHQHLPFEMIEKALELFKPTIEQHFS